jgi:hypothetical protein
VAVDPWRLSSIDFHYNFDFSFDFNFSSKISAITAIKVTAKVLNLNNNSTPFIMFKIVRIAQF